MNFTITYSLTWVFLLLISLEQASAFNFSDFNASDTIPSTSDPGGSASESNSNKKSVTFEITLEGTSTSNDEIMIDSEKSELDLLTAAVLDNLVGLVVDKDDVSFSISSILDNNTLKYDATATTHISNKDRTQLETFNDNEWLKRFVIDDIKSMTSYDNIVFKWSKSCKENEDETVFAQIRLFLTYALIGLFGISCLFTIAGYAHSWIKWVDDVRIGQAVFFTFSMLDWYSDILFTFSLESCKYPDQALILFITSFALLAFPLIGNVYWLLKNQSKWEEDYAVGSRLIGWLRRWRPWLFFFTILSGSAFGAVNLTNCNVFGYPLFRMGLKTRLIDEFDAKRLWIVVVFENLPQLGLQGYWVFLGGTENLDAITAMAMISGIISIIYAIATICSANSSTRTRSTNSEGVFSFRVVSRDLRGGNKAYKTDVFALGKKLAELLQVDHQLLEMHLPHKSDDGIVVTFTVDDTQERGQDVYLKMQKLIKSGKLYSRLQETWRLKLMPTIEDFQWLNATDEDKSRAEAIKISNENAREIKKTPRGVISDPGPGPMPGSGGSPRAGDTDQYARHGTQEVGPGGPGSGAMGVELVNAPVTSVSQRMLGSQSPSQKHLLSNQSANPLDNLQNVKMAQNSNSHNNNNNNVNNNNNNNNNYGNYNNSGNNYSNNYGSNVNNANNGSQYNQNVATVALFQQMQNQQTYNTSQPVHYQSGSGGIGPVGAMNIVGGYGSNRNMNSNNNNNNINGVGGSNRNLNNYGNGANVGNQGGNFDYDYVARYNNIGNMEDSVSSQHGGFGPGEGEGV